MVSRTLRNLVTRLLLIGTCGVAGSGLAETSPLVNVGAIDGESDTRLSIVNIRLDKQPSMSQVGELQDHGSFLQLTLPNAVVPEPGKFFDGNNPHLPKIAVFQMTPTEAAIRFFAASDTAAIKRAAQAEILGSRIVLTVDHAKLAAGAAATPGKPFVGPPAPEELRPKPAVSASEVIAKTEVSHDIPAPAAQIKDGTSLATGGLDLRDKLVRVAAFSGVLLLALGASWFARPLLRRRARRREGDEPAVSMRTISSLALAPRQKVSLIQVGDERILIGVTPEAVTFLTTIAGTAARQREPRALPFARALEDSVAPSVEMRQAPVLKKLDGNDEVTLSTQAPTPRAAEPAKPAPARRQARDEGPAASKGGGRINLTVGDDGVKRLESRPAPRPAKSADDGSQQAIDDVTRLIREKLKTLRTI